MSQGTIDYDRAIVVNGIRCQPIGRDDDAYHLPRATNISSLRWFHGTRRGAGWLNSVIENDAFVHLGTADAAYSRCPMCFMGDVHYFVVELKPEARIFPEILFDNWDEWPQDVGSDETEYDVYPYLNEVEDAGSISLMVDPRILSVTEVHTDPIYLMKYIKSSEMRAHIKRIAQRVT